jgi:hypothetical protein
MKNVLETKMNYHRFNYRKTGLSLLLIAGILFLAVNLIYWITLARSNREFSLAGAILVGLLLGLIPFAITFIAYFYPFAVSIISILMSLITLIYWINVFFQGSESANLLFLSGEMFSAVIFLVGGILSFIGSGIGKSRT